ncbi:TIGR03620 family F420-dependent LLM class oxidoreductase [Lapillicoccus jejuensis]|uniref:Putative F420-dependent oxidoreductase n=1 Tax=Lapillicoccus jejuensis TaxID=402171 RepID=A0A542E554_9MICO|nr:TIGR03620 family F420-dependent LLM class oxidoreductase [Lapillicoccus jejuensis]TQJ10414.1 putative F420-dependent oxidoreductase [Lapillicoccus jejuensis]
MTSTPQSRSVLGRYGLWQGEAGWSPQLATAAEEAGFTTLWVGGSPGGDLEVVARLLESTREAIVGTSIVNVWKDDAAPIAEVTRRLHDRFPGRFFLGIGIGHPEATRTYKKPYETLVDYLDALDAAGVDASTRLLAALGPRVLRLSRDRTAGAIPYLTTPQHTREARDILGDGAVLAAEHKVALSADPEQATRLAHETLGFYLGLVNYRRNLEKLGYDAADLEGSGSERLADDLVLRGDLSHVVAGLRAHLESGADHVAVNLLLGEGDDPVEQVGRLGAALRA